MLENKDYCDYETCVALKELGYIGQGRCYYDLDKEPHKLRHFGIQVLTTRSAKILNLILAVHLYDAQKWLREEKDIFIYPIVDKFLDEEGNTMWNCQIYIPYILIKFTHPKNTFENALLDGIKEAIKFIKENEET